jgi:hypothetical protein
MTYSLIRLGIFTGIFVLLMAVNLEWWIAALLATVMAFALSYIFFYRQRAQLAADLEALVRRSKASDPDSAAEDQALDSEGDGPTQSKSEDN